jgi:hypothetical protein
MTVQLSMTSNTGTFQGGTFTIGPLVINSTFSSLQVNALTFGSGTFISTSSPAGSFGVIIDPPSSNQVQLTLKGVTGDTGIPIAPNLPTVIPFYNVVVANAVGLTSASSITGNVTLTFF